MARASCRGRCRRRRCFLPVWRAGGEGALLRRCARAQETRLILLSMRPGSAPARMLFVLRMGAPYVKPRSSRGRHQPRDVTEWAGQGANVCGLGPGNRIGDQTSHWPTALSNRGRGLAPGLAAQVPRAAGALSRSAPYRRGGTGRSRGKGPRALGGALAGGQRWGRELCRHRRRARGGGQRAPVNARRSTREQKRMAKTDGRTGQRLSLGTSGCAQCSSGKQSTRTAGRGVLVHRGR
jgi:hypothetical protein